MQFDLPPRAEGGRRSFGLACDCASGAALLGFPGARALAAGPGACPDRAGEAPLGGGALAAGAHPHDHTAVAADLAGDGDDIVAGVEERALGDADRIAVGA